MQIGNKVIGNHLRPFIIAEMSGNHNQSLERALSIVDAAAKHGADAIKIQTYTAETMTLNLNKGEFFIDDPSSLWLGKSLFDLYKQAYTPWEWHEAIIKRAMQNGILCFSSPFDASAVDFLESLNIPCYKIASFECIDLPLIQKVAKTRKPIILSTGMASLTEISEAIDTALSAGCQEIALLKCTSTYPANPINSNLRTIPHLRDAFKFEVGLSDHTVGIGTSVAAVALGATIIEKHFTLSRQEGGVDSAFSLEPSELAMLVTETERAWQSLGIVHYGPTEAENNAVNRRRSLYISEDLNAGDILTKNNLRCIRPGLGLPPKFFEIFLGKRVNRPLKKGTPVDWSILT